LNQATQAPSFVIPIYDTGSGPIQVSLLYTSGAADSNPTVVNPIFVSGSSDVSKQLTVTPTAQDEAGRASALAETIYNQLVQIEGK